MGRVDNPQYKRDYESQAGHAVEKELESTGWRSLFFRHKFQRVSERYEQTGEGGLIRTFPNLEIS